MPTTETLLQALQQIERRAERTPDEDQILRTYVESKTLVAALGARDNGVLFGRRGTGKTHALRYLAERERSKGNFALFVDVDKMLGSTTGIYADSDMPVHQRATRLIGDVLALLYDTFLEDAFTGKLDMLIEKLETMLDHFGEVVVVERAEVESGRSHEDTSSSTGSMTISLSANPALGMSGGGGSGSTQRREDRRRVSGPVAHRVHFGELSGIMRETIAAHPAERIWLLFDEWSALPKELQPYLAEMLRRLFFGIPKVTVRIAAIPHRTSWRIPRPDGDYIGAEIGAELFSLLDLDEFVVFPARNRAEQKERAGDFFKTLLFKHLTQALEDLGDDKLTDEDQAVSLLFTQITAFHELVRAAEGVPRDALVIVSRAGLRASDRKISTDHVRDGAAQVYQTSKAILLNGTPAARRLLDLIIDTVTSERRARAFMLRQDDTEHSIIQQLVDDRILHIIKRGYSHQDEPGDRYDVLQIDYGCYVHLLATASAPLSLFGEGAPEEDEVLGAFYGGVVVPTDDYRAIRRSVLDLPKKLAQVEAELNAASSA